MKNPVFAYLSLVAALFMLGLQGCATWRTISPQKALQLENRNIVLLHQGETSWISRDAKINDHSELAGTFNLWDGSTLDQKKERELQLFLNENAKPFPDGTSGSALISKESIREAKIYSIDGGAILVVTLVSIAAVPLLVFFIAALLI